MTGTIRVNPTLGVACLIAAAVLAAGCGEDNDEGGFSPVVAEPLTKVEFLREADRICLGAEAQIEAAADDLLTGRGRPDPDEVERVATGVVIPSLEAEVEAIRALTAPPGDEQRVEAILAATEEGIAEIRANPRDVSGGVPEPLRRAQRLAEDYGSRECGLRG